MSAKEKRVNTNKEWSIEQKSTTALKKGRLYVCVMIMHFQVGNSIGYRYEDVMNDEWKEIILDAEISVDSEKNALVPVKAMTEYLTSTGTLEADVQE